MTNHFKTKPILILAMLFCLCLISSAWLIGQTWQGTWEQLLQFQHDDVRALALHLKLLPSIAIAVLAGGLLGLSSALLQQLIHNPLVSESTLAVASGAKMSLLLVAVFVPSWGLFDNIWVASIGAMFSMAVVFLLALPSRFNPVILVLSGLIINILLTAIASLILLFYSESAMGVLLWGAGQLQQSSWQPVWQLAGLTLLASVFCLPFLKPLQLMSLDDRQAKSLGVPVNGIRAIVLLLVAMLVASVVSRVGVIAFIGLAAVSVVNTFAVRNIAEKLGYSFGFGAVLLWLTHNVVGWIEWQWAWQIPAGAMTGILGMPLLLYLILKQAKQPAKTEEMDSLHYQAKRSYWGVWTVLFMMSFVIVLCFAPMLNATQQLVWQWNMDWAWLQQFRLGRSLTAVAVGMILAMAGVLLQNLTRNPMASPEVLGISAGAALGIVLGFVGLPFLGMAINMATLAVTGLIGAMLVLALVLWLARLVSSAYLLLVGVAISALFSGVMTFIQASGDPRLQAVLAWLSGSTYQSQPMWAWGFLVFAILMFSVVLVLIRPLQLFSLGADVAQARGLNSRIFSQFILFLVAMMSVVATLSIGPLSFVGLMIPHLALALGAVKLRSQLCLSAVLGAMLMLWADWVGRYVIFPYEIPAGTLAGVIGAGYFMLLMRKMG